MIKKNINNFINIVHRSKTYEENWYYWSDGRRSFRFEREDAD